MMKPNDLDAEALGLEMEAAGMGAALEAANLREDQIIASHRALIEPREKAANLLRQAANAIRAIPPMGLSAGQGK